MKKILCGYALQILLKHLVTLVVKICYDDMFRLLQSAECPENFEDKNYTIITSRCKGPEYPADQCCPAFKEFACPIRDKINDPKTDCAQTMFSYINLYGRFPPGLFAHKCREGKEGLKCDEPTLPPSGSAAAVHSTSLLLTAGFLVLLPLMLQRLKCEKPIIRFLHFICFFLP